MCTYVHVLYCVLFYWYLLCSLRANFYVIRRQQRFCILYSDADEDDGDGDEAQDKEQEEEQETDEPCMHRTHCKIYIFLRRPASRCDRPLISLRSRNTQFEWLSVPSHVTRLFIGQR